jgi:hypothetical protein
MAFGIQNTIQRHASPPKEIDFLLIQPRNFMFGVWQANERNVFILPKTLKLRDVIWPDCQNDNPAFSELLIFIPQARQLRAAIGSHEAAQKIEYDGSAAKFGKTNVVALYIIQFKIGRGISRYDRLTHSAAILLLLPKCHQTFSPSTFRSVYFADSGDRSTITIDQSSVHTLHHVQT